MKKLLFVILTCIIMTQSVCFSVSAKPGPGSVIGKVLSTDIVTYIDSIRVPSFNIKGRTAVVAENLNMANLGFKVIYNDSNRTLIILRGNSDVPVEDPFCFDPDTSSQRVGTEIMNVMFTDIKTYYYTYKNKDALSSEEMESFNIGGYTCIYADDLAKMCGTYLWDEEARTVSIVTKNESSGYGAVETKEAHRNLSAKETVITRDETFDRWRNPSTSHLVKNSDGTYSAVEIDEHINIETYDSELNHKTSYSIKKELPLFGALLIGKNYNYIAFGQENLLDDNSREVLKIVIYDKNFVKISEVSVNNCKTAVPFDASNCSLSENERYLVLHTSRSQYKDEHGNRPQTQLTVIVDKNTWSVSNMLGKFQYNHISHALGQFVKFDSDRLITANFSDAAPLRGAFLQELGMDGKVIHTQSIFNVGGPLGANSTGAMIGGLEVSSAGYLVPISTIDHSLAGEYTNLDIGPSEHQTRDIYLLWADKNTWELRHTCCASYADTGYTGSVPYLVDLGNDTFMILWQRFTNSDLESNVMCYAFIDANGYLIGDVRTAQGRLSDSCQPIVSGEKVLWYVNTPTGRTFYSISTDPSVIIEAPVPPEVILPPTEEALQNEISSPSSEDESAKENEDDSKPSLQDKETQNKVPGLAGIELTDPVSEEDAAQKDIDLKKETDSEPEGI